MSKRDEFPAAIRDTLAKRVANFCSRPGCGQITSGPHLNVTKAVNLGVAAHITAAAPNGPRYDPTMTSDQRRHINNGIWLCQPCSALIDRDPDRYTTATLHRWKADAEALAHRRLSERPLSIMTKSVTEELAAYRISIQQRFKQLHWCQSPLSLHVFTAKGVQDGHSYVSNWCISDLSRHLIIVGEAGAGKSGLVLWAESKLQERDDVVTLLVPAARLKNKSKFNIDVLFSSAVPTLSCDLVDYVGSECTLVLLLDGLDELVGAGREGLAVAIAAIKGVASSLPARTRVIATCRKAPYLSIDHVLRDVLPDNISDQDALYQFVVDKAVYGTDPIEVIEIAPVPKAAALSFLSSTVPPQKLSFLEESRWETYLGSPMVLALLQLILPVLLK